MKNLRMRRPRGFTLIEVMVALAIMGIVAAMAWQGIEAIIRAQQFSRARSDEIAVMQTMMAQWDNDLTHVDFNAGGNYLKDIPPLDYQNNILRLVRWDDGRGDRALRVVCWAKRLNNADADPKTGAGILLRWQSAPITTASDLRQAWAAAQTWAQGSESSALRAQELALMPISQWQLQVFQEGDWAADAPISANTAGQVRVQGLRLVLSPSGSALFTGSLTHDWLRPSAPGI